MSLSDGRDDSREATMVDSIGRGHSGSSRPSDKLTGGLWWGGPQVSGPDGPRTHDDTRVIPSGTARERGYKCNHPKAFTNDHELITIAEAIGQTELVEVEEMNLAEAIDVARNDPLSLTEAQIAALHDADYELCSECGQLLEGPEDLESGLCEAHREFIESLD